MKVKIVRSSDIHYWYAKSVGEEYSVICIYPEDNVFLVRDNEGYLNIIRMNDAEIIKEIK